MVLEKQTPDSMQYQFFENTTKAIKFKVRAANDAHVALTTGPSEGVPMYEVFIGGWGNSKIAFRRNREKPEVCEVPVPGTLSDGEFREFWLTWYGQNLALGQGENPNPILVWEDPQLLQFGFVGIRTAWGASGQWLIDENWQGFAPQQGGGVGWNVNPAMQPGYGPAGVPTWRACSGSNFPPDAVEGGFDNERLFIGRSMHNGSMVPGKIVPSHGCCYVAWGGQEHAKPDYEILTGCNPQWVPVTGDQLPMNAVTGGTSENGEPLYIGRAHHKDTLTPGKVQISHRVCYIPYGGQEIAVTNFEVLVL